MVLSKITEFVGAKIAGAVITLAVIAGASWCYEDQEEVVAFGRIVK